jgi:hypothetical protein
MANPSHPDDPYRVPNDPYRSPDGDIRRPARLDNELQPDPELAEGPASGARITMLAVAIAVILGAVFYGVNNSSMHQAGTAPTAQNTAQDSPPAAPPGMRDVTPHSNSQPGMTTGAASAKPQAPPATANPSPPNTPNPGAPNSGSNK